MLSLLTPLLRWTSTATAGVPNHRYEGTRTASAPVATAARFRGDSLVIHARARTNRTNSAFMSAAAPTSAPPARQARALGAVPGGRTATRTRPKKPNEIGR